MFFLNRYNMATIEARARKRQKVLRKVDKKKPAKIQKIDEETTTEESTSEEDSDDENNNMSSLLKEPEAPKRLASGRLKGLVDDISVMKFFVRHLTSIDGGTKKKAVAINHMRTVGRLWYQVESKPHNPKKLWSPRRSGGLCSKGTTYYQKTRGSNRRH